MPLCLIDDFLSFFSLPKSIEIVSVAAPILTSDNRTAFVNLYNQKKQATQRAFDLLKQHRVDQHEFKALVVVPSFDSNNKLLLFLGHYL